MAELPKEEYSIARLFVFIWDPRLVVGWNGRIHVEVFKGNNSEKEVKHELGNSCLGLGIDY